MRAPTPPLFHYGNKPILSPERGVPWADTMVLNPTIIDDPRSNRLHMLFRASGPWPAAASSGKPLPYPIFLGYAFSDDEGATWQADFSRPCLAPRLAKKADDFYVRNRDGNLTLNYANGCIEDPRLFRLEDKVYVTVASRLFPPGPYWEQDDPMQCAPGWAKNGEHPFGRAGRENLTVSVLFEVNLQALAQHEYAEAFRYVTSLTDPERGDNRDVVLFPRSFSLEGREHYLCLHRPMEPAQFGGGADLPPSIFLAAAERLQDLGTSRARHRLLARSKFVWEGNRIGTSWTPLPLGHNEWLLPYHGKQDAKVGYTQSFMILGADVTGGLEVKHRCPTRLMYAHQLWELAGRFTTPCLFTCGGIRRGEKLIMTYGAADTVSGLAWVNFDELVGYVRRFDSNGLMKSFP